MIKLSKYSATHIVKEVSGLIQQHVNVMDNLGYIIASTDESRIGTFHEGARDVITKQLDLLMIEDENQYIGVRKGINLPIVVENEIIGVIGITGDREQVELYGQIIKKMTEILVMEAERKESSQVNEKIRTRYMEEWLFHSGVTYDKAFITRGENLGIDITYPRRIIVIAPIIEKAQEDSKEGQIFLEDMEKCLKKWIEKEKEGNLFFRSRNRMIGLITKRSDEKMIGFGRALEEWVQDKYKVKLAIGIDKIQEGWENLHKAYVCAKKAFSSAYIDRKNNIKLYDEITLELLTEEMPNELKQEFVYKIFNQLADKEIQEMLLLIDEFVECNGSITTAAKNLFMHKNTLQYKLNRIYEKTDHNPRELKDLPILYMASILYKQLQDEKKTK